MFRLFVGLFFLYVGIDWVLQIVDMGVYVKFFEYDNIDGMILFFEFFRWCIRLIQKFICVGCNEVVVVFCVDKEKGYIDFFKCCVLFEDIICCEECYNKFKIVYFIMRYVVEKIEIFIEIFYEIIGWLFNKKYGYLLDVFKFFIMYVYLLCWGVECILMVMQ